MISCKATLSPTLNNGHMHVQTQSQKNKAWPDLDGNDKKMNRSIDLLDGEIYAPRGFLCRCQSYLLHRVQPKALLVLHLIDLNRSVSNHTYFVMADAHHLPINNSAVTNKSSQMSCQSKGCVPCSTTARIPSSEQIIAGRILDDDELVRLEEWV